MTTLTVKQLYEQYIKRLSLTEMRQLVAIIQAYLVKAEAPRRQWAEVPRRQWAEIAGGATYPLAGEDAQDWVSRARFEGDRQRQKQWVAEE